MSNKRSASPEEIVRAILRDMGTDALSISQGITYCDRIASGAKLNPWAEPDMAANYETAACLLRGRS